MPKKKLPKLGRPNLPKEKLRGNVVPVRLQDDERAEFQRAADNAGLSFSEWVRQALRQAAKEADHSTIAKSVIY